MGRNPSEMDFVGVVKWRLVGVEASRSSVFVVSVFRKSSTEEDGGLDERELWSRSSEIDNQIHLGFPHSG